MTAAGKDIVLRPYSPGDRDACAAIYVAGRRSAFHWCRPGQFVAADFDRDSAGEAITVAVSGGRVCGFVSLWMPDHFVHLLFIDPPLHGLGIGRSLLRHVEQTFGDWAWLKCQAQNESALAFYRACGWTVGAGGENELGPWVAVSWNAAAPLHDRQDGTA